MMAGDFTDRVFDEWRTVRPDIDVSSVGVVNRVLRLARFFESVLDEVATRYGLSTKGDFDTLAALRRQSPTPELSPTHLAELALITTGGMTSRLDRLEDRGFVERRSDPGDRRALLVRLTESGQEIVDRVLDASLPEQRRMLDTIGEKDRAVLASLLRRLLVDAEAV
jgi:DNA-binding MarR family transcriptional regulator